MHPQLQAIIAEFRTASERLERLTETVPVEQWTIRAEGNGWSIADCVVHLNLTSRAYLPVLHTALEEGRRSPSPPRRRRYRRDPVGWLLWRTMGPPVRLRFRTSEAFLPHGSTPVAEFLEEFEHLQVAQIACVEEAEGLALQRLWIRSPFDARVRYNLYSALCILPRHQHRHLWQAEQLAGSVRPRD